jgi:glutamyl-tRNA synthetase
VVVDDHDMNITHVIRGEDHLSNTPRQIQVYRALGFSPPQFAHLPMILGPDKTRLSKRHGATAIESYREEGFLPEAMINYLALLGWSYGDQTIFTVDELIEKFSLDQVSKAGAIFDYDKLRWLNSVYIKNLSNEKLAQLYRPYLAKAGFEVEEKSDEWLATLANATKERISTLSEIPRWSDFLFKEVEYDQKAVDKVLKQGGVVEILEQVQATLAQLEVWQHEEIEETLRALVDKLQKKTKVVFQPIRVAVTGRLVSPPLFESLELLGKRETLARLEKAQKLIQKLE